MRRPPGPVAADVGSFCGELVADDARIQQSLVCLREAVSWLALKPKDVHPIALQQLARIPGLRPDELRRLAPTGLPMLTGVSECERGMHVPPESVLGYEVFASADAEAGPESAVYSSLASAESNRRIRYCYQSLAAKTCAASITTPTGCSDPRSIAHYIQVAVREDSYAIEAINEGIANIIGTQGVLYSSWRDAGGGGAVRRRGSELEEVTLALFEIHMVLAYTFHDNPGLAEPRGIHSVRWHIGLAMERWHELEPERRFPIEMLDEAMLNEAVRGVSLRDFIRERETVAASPAAGPSH